MEKISDQTIPYMTKTIDKEEISKMIKQFGLKNTKLEDSEAIMKDLINLLNSKTINNISNQESSPEIKQKEVHNYSISIEEFISSVLEKSKQTGTQAYEDFYLAVLNFYFTPSERISKTLDSAIEKLKQDFSNKQVVKELNWMRKVLNEKSIFDFNINSLKGYDLLLSQDLNKNEIFQWLSEYSNYSMMKQNTEDLESLTMKSQISSNSNLGTKSRRSSQISTGSIEVPFNLDITNKLQQKDLSSVNKLILGMDVNLFQSIFKDDFNVFKFHSELKEFSMFAVTQAILNFYSLMGKNGTMKSDKQINKVGILAIDSFENFISKVRLNYKDNHYHNQIHAIDVIQTCFTFAVKLELADELSDLDMSALFISCLLHDVGHPGLNNTYQINKQTKLALRYNDKSVLENFHVFLGFKLISEENSNILKNLSKEEYRIFRKRFVECILSTDMTHHSKVVGAVKYRMDCIEKLEGGSSKTLIKLPENDKEKIEEIEGQVSIKMKKLSQVLNSADKQSRYENEQNMMNYLIHCADVSNPAKKFDLAEKWARLMIEESFAQGDLERKEGLPISFLCDRETVNVPKCQVGFITSIIQPMFKVLTTIELSFQDYENNIEDNIVKWRALEK